MDYFLKYLNLEETLLFVSLQILGVSSKLKLL